MKIDSGATTPKNPEHPVYIKIEGHEVLGASGERLRTRLTQAAKRLDTLKQASIGAFPYLPVSLRNSSQLLVSAARALNNGMLFEAAIDLDKLEQKLNKIEQHICARGYPNQDMPDRALSKTA